MSDNKTPKESNEAQQEETEFVPIKVESNHPIRFALTIFSIVLTIGVIVWGVWYFNTGGKINRQVQVQPQPTEPVVETPVKVESKPKKVTVSSTLLTVKSNWADTQKMELNCKAKDGGDTVTSNGLKSASLSAPALRACEVKATNTKGEVRATKVMNPFQNKGSTKGAGVQYHCFAHGQEACVPEGFLGISFIPQKEVGNYSAECDGLTASGQGRLDMSLSSAKRCKITTEKDKISFRVRNLKAGNYVCFVKGQPVCVPEGEENRVVALKELSKEDEKRLKREKGISFSKTEVSGPGYLTISADWKSIVFIDGKKIRKSPLYKHSVAPGKRRISLYSEEGRIQKFSINVKSAHQYTYKWSFEKNDWLMKDINNLAKNKSAK